MAIKGLSELLKKHRDLADMTDEQFDKGWDDALNGRESSETRMIDAPADTASAAALRRSFPARPRRRYSSVT